MWVDGAAEFSLYLEPSGEGALAPALPSVLPEVPGETKYAIDLGDSELLLILQFYDSQARALSSIGAQTHAAGMHRTLDN